MVPSDLNDEESAMEKKEHKCKRQESAEPVPVTERKGSGAWDSVKGVAGDGLGQKAE